MKNFLIPTRLTPDTISAVKTAIHHSKNENSKIVLLYVSEEIDVFAAVHYLRKQNYQISKKEMEVLDNCRNLIEYFPNCKFEFKHQFGINTPLLKNLIQYYKVDLILLTKSIITSPKSVHSHLVNSIKKQKKPILHLINDETPRLNKAIYVENTYSRLNIDDIQQYLSHQFPSQQISKVLKKEPENSEFLDTLLEEVLSKNDIDFVIETRSTERSKIKNKKQVEVNQHIDIPVLSLHEETV
ncbi:hypothetical protein [Flavobacterium adhaerens]|uniref:hypothetical protein n=1 Tax=Flavobacterium adhaerens TaxID=3149043 RepID=UPI0032B35E33